MSSPANNNSRKPSGSSSVQPREVMNVSVLAESELGSEAQRERRKRILDATMAIASKGGYEAVQYKVPPFDHIVSRIVGKLTFFLHSATSPPAASSPPTTSSPLAS